MATIKIQNTNTELLKAWEKTLLSALEILEKSGLKQSDTFKVLTSKRNEIIKELRLRGKF